MQTPKRGNTSVWTKLSQNVNNDTWLLPTVSEEKHGDVTGSKRWKQKGWLFPIPTTPPPPCLPSIYNVRLYCVATVHCPYTPYLRPNSRASIDTNYISFWGLFFCLFCFLFFISCHQEQSLHFSPKCNMGGLGCNLWKTQLIYLINKQMSELSCDNIYKPVPT